MNFQDMPKVELHTHLEGCAPPEFIRMLAKEKGLDLSGIFNADGTYAYRDFDHFLEVYEAACTTLQGPQDFYRLTKAVLEESASHGVVYQETFISPDFCGGGDLGAWREYLAAMEEAAAEADRDLGITLRGIVTVIRHFGPEAGKPAAHCGVETFGGFVRGFGMAGGEMVGRPADYSYLFDQAREAGMPLHCHAGEWGGPSMVQETLDHLKVDRIGHGIGAIDDPALVQRLADSGVTLEVCPGSNVFLGAVDSWESHPIQKLRDAGVKVTVSTDDPPFFGTTMTREYEMLNKTFGWTKPDFDEVNRTALAAAFCDDATRQTIAKRLDIA
ncbi:adenosine deaminase [Thalassorhabdomicrobium marinisediminis]|uniref:Adenosine deaminase n=1 Tax=Thalassorhabdomicrobium marinisediminis TaxID=2170577 RepID=A0A2T7FWX6_9RHOB|nr:adenosine deaminase [Thalassorhabdomicrobium marinisediminis]PVA06673.1 adenosine deaminase [Thalassorhabdomicrobium marinisediminis]